MKAWATSRALGVDLQLDPGPRERPSRSAVSRAEPAWQTAIQEILGGAVASAELTALSLTLAALRSDLERRNLGLPTG